MFINNLNIIHKNIYAYLLIDFKTFDILDGNKLAKEYYFTSTQYPKVTDLFFPASNDDTIKEILKQLDCNDSAIINNIESVRKDGEKFPCHIELCKINNNTIFIVIKENGKTENVEIEQIVELFENPIFVVKQDEKLTLTYGNNKCHQYLPTNKSKISILSMLDKDKQLIASQSINEQVDLYGECSVEIEVQVEESAFRLFNLNAYKSTFDGQLYGVLISAKSQSELIKKIEYDQQYFDIMQQFSKDLLFRIDVNKKILYHRNDTTNFIGLSNEIIDYPESIRDLRLVHPDDLEGYIAYAYRLMNGATATYDVRFQFLDGSYEKYRLQASPIFDYNGNVVQVVGKSENIQKYVELKHRADYDVLTSALNKQSFKELIESNIARSVATDKFALLFIDFDDFKNVNDSMGHVFGDFLLETTGKRIINCIRSHDKLGRVGGDEFIVFFQFAPNHETVLERAEAILHTLRREFTYADIRYHAKASIGISLFPEHGTDYTTLYQNADTALYKSKTLGKDIATIYSKDLDKEK